MSKTRAPAAQGSPGILASKAGDATGDNPASVATANMETPADGAKRGSEARDKEDWTSCSKAALEADDGARNMSCEMGLEEETSDDKETKEAGGNGHSTNAIR